MDITYFEQSSFVDPKSIILESQIPKKKRPDGANLILTVNINSDVHRYLLSIAKSCFRKKKTQDAFIMAYYLHYYLSHIYHLEDCLKQKDLMKILHVNNTTLHEIQVALNVYKLIGIDKSRWVNSLKKKLNKEKQTKSRIKSFAYKAYEPIFSDQESKDKPLKYPIKYSIPSLIINKLKTKIPNYDLSLPITSTILHILITDSRSKPQKQNKLSICKNDIYIPPYWDLKFSEDLLNMSLSDAIKLGNVEKLSIWNKGWNKKVKLSSGRIYHCFHNTPRAFRKYLEYQGSPLVEAMDIHNAFFVFLGKIFRTVPSIDRDELNRYQELVRSGRLYEDVMAYLGTKDRDMVKERINIYRNLPSRRMCRRPEHKYFKEKYPTITKYLMHFPTYVKDGNDIKYIQIDASYIETVVMSEVCKELYSMGATPFSLHDAIYINEKDKEELDKKGIDVNAIFWRKFDSLSDSEIEAILEESRNCHANKNS